MNDETWIALQRRCLPRALPMVTQTSSDDWLVVDERETVVAVISPETYWATNDSTTAEARAYLIAAAPEMYELLEEYAQIVDADAAADWFQRRQALLDKIEGGTE